MSSRITMPAIAGGPVTTWKKGFCSGVTEWSGEPVESLPLKGSLGISYSVKGDLATLFKLCNGNYCSFKAALQGTLKKPTPGFKGEAKPITAIQTQVIFEFVQWALGDQPFFLLRKGTEVLGLYRKTSSYYYDASAGTPHRISFELVSACSEEERAHYKTQMTRVPASLVWLGHSVPPTPAEEKEAALEHLRAVRARVAELSFELDSLISALKG